MLLRLLRLLLLLLLLLPPRLLQPRHLLRLLPSRLLLRHRSKHLRLPRPPRLRILLRIRLLRPPGR